MDELNRKLAEWAGFKRKLTTRVVTDGGQPYGYTGTRIEDVYYWVCPNGRHRDTCPQFTHFPGLCFKWLVPKLLELGWLPCVSRLEFEHLWSAELCHPNADDMKYEWLDSKEETPALALCKAIEGLIDAG